MGSSTLNALSSTQAQQLGINAKALKIWGNKNPELTQVFNHLEKSGEIMNRRRAIVRQMQIDNMMKSSQQPKGNKQS